MSIFMNILCQLMTAIYRLYAAFWFIILNLDLALKQKIPDIQILPPKNPTMHCPSSRDGRWVKLQFCESAVSAVTQSADDSYVPQKSRIQSIYSFYGAFQWRSSEAPHASCCPIRFLFSSSTNTLVINKHHASLPLFIQVKEILLRMFT